MCQFLKKGKRNQRMKSRLLARKKIILAAAEGKRGKPKTDREGRPKKRGHWHLEKRKSLFQRTRRPARKAFENPPLLI